MTFFLGLTGSIATGKSTADAFFKEKNIPIIDADQVAHELMEPGQKSYQAIVKYFGEDILKDDQTIDRKKLGQIVFNDSNELKRLNDLTHPIIRNEIVRQMEHYRDAADLVVVDVPLLFESHFEDLCTKVLVISAKPEIQLKRLMLRNNLNKTQALSRIRSQMPLEQKEKLADYVVSNNADVADFKKKLCDLLNNIGK